MHTPLTAPQQCTLAKAGFAHIEWVAPLCAGTSNQNFHIRARGREWVLRINNPLTEALCPRANEVSCWQLAADAGLAPALEYVSDDHAIYISQFIAQATPWSAHYPHIENAPQLIDELLQSLAKLALPKHRVTPSQQWAHYRQLLESHPAMPLHLQAECHQVLSLNDEMLQSLTRLSERENTRFCHRDLNPHNLLLHKGRLMCIDFEYACASDPRMELAALLTSHTALNFEPDLLHHLAGTASQQQQDLADAKLCYWVFTSAWSLLMCADGKPARPWLEGALKEIARIIGIR
ncbi:phosphotransferase [Simiduia sp. 21SJ11W-1]|uniref:phosphotransferase n=1 Tax=Simiduia sp. 21SJ11W-1 TaxID=2909669 RepID=UPI0020A2246F|nr:phosphotransferase [Simiduia sp. 21SJ11W-1]UTA47140.1 phosphotransferase [Simiduia sp. 21SJ11W-1]